MNSSFFTSKNDKMLFYFNSQRNCDIRKSTLRTLKKKKGGKKTGREGERRLHTIKMKYIESSYHLCIIICLLHSVSGEGGPEAGDRQLVGSRGTQVPVRPVLPTTPHILFLILRLPHIWEQHKSPKMGVSVWCPVTSQASGMTAARVSGPMGGGRASAKPEPFGWKEAQSSTVKSLLLLGRFSRHSSVLSSHGSTVFNNQFSELLDYLSKKDMLKATTIIITVYKMFSWFFSQTPHSVSA